MSDRPPALAVRYWGVRGSVPAPGAGTARYGGNTACVELRAGDGRRLVLDAGTGLRVLGDALLAAPDPPAVVPVLVTHGHADHVHGLPFFAPLAHGRTHVELWASPPSAEGVRGAVHALLRPPLFPAGDGPAARLRVHELSLADETPVGGFLVRPLAMVHPGGACGFVVRDPAGGGRVAYLPDNELAATDDDARAVLVDALAGVDALVHDATYLPGELAAHRGWGHSSYDEAVRLAADAGVRRLVLFHHHPARDDAAVDALLGDARRAAAARGGGPEVSAAAEGGELVVHGPTAAGRAAPAAESASC